LVQKGLPHLLLQVSLRLGSIHPFAALFAHCVFSIPWHSLEKCGRFGIKDILKEVTELVSDVSKWQCRILLLLHLLMQRYYIYRLERPTMKSKSIISAFGFVTKESMTGKR